MLVALHTDNPVLLRVSLAHIPEHREIFSLYQGEPTTLVSTHEYGVLA
jgi:hypothetical protein